MSIPRLCLSLVLLVSSMAGRAIAQDPAPKAESGLEPEFRQLRAKLAAQPEFGGTDAVSKFRLAEELARRGDVQGAIETYRAAIHLKADWPDPYRGLGQVLLDHHDYSEAVQALQTGIRLGRDDHQAFYWLGRAFMGKGDLPASAIALERAAELKPDDADTFADLGLVRMAQGDVAGTEQALTRAIRLKPDLADAHRLRERLMKAQGDPELAREAGAALLKSLFARE